MGRAKRILIWAGAIFAVLLLIVAGAAFFVLRTDPGHRWLTATVNAQLAGPDGSGIVIGSIDGPLPGRVHVSSIRMRDTEGVWLEVDRVAMTWRPLALLSGNFDVQTLDVSGIHVERAPIPVAPPQPLPAEPFRLPSLPVDITVEQLSVSDVRIAEPVVGMAATLQARGRMAALETGTLSTELTVERTDGSPGRIDLNAEYVQSQDTLRIALQVAEPAGGLIARTIALPGLPPVSIALNGEGPLSQWDGKLIADLGDAVGATADINIDRIGNDYSLGVSGGARLSPLAPEAIRPLLANGIDFAVEGKTRGSNVVELERARVVASGATAIVSGTFDTNSKTIDGRAEVVVPDPSAFKALMAPLSTAAIEVQASFKGAMLAPQIELHLKTSHAALPQVELDGISADILIAPTDTLDRGFRGRATFDAEVDALKATAPNAPPIPGPLTVRAVADVDQPAHKIDVTELRIESPQLRLTGNGASDLVTFASTADLQLAIPALAPLSSLVGKPIEGSVEATAHLRAGEGLEELTAQLSATLRDAGPAGTPLAVLIGKATKLDAEIGTDKDGSHRGRLEVAAPSANLDASATVSADLKQVEASYKATVAQLGAFSSLTGLPLAGRAILSGDAKGPLTDPDITASLRVENGAVADQSLGTVDGKLRVHSPTSAARGKVVIAATPPAGRAAMATDFAVNGQKLQVTGLRIETLGEALTGQFAVPLGGGAIEGSLAGRIGNIGPILAFGGAQGAGTAALRLRLFGERGVQAAEANVDLRDVRVAQTGNEVRLARLSVDGRAALADPIRVNATVGLTELRSGAAQVESATVTVGGNLKRLDVALRAKGDANGPFTADAAATANLDGGGAAVTLTRLNGVAHKQQITLRPPAQIVWRPQRVEVRGFDLALGTGRLRADMDLAPSRVEGTVDLSALPLSFVRAFVPGAAATGSVSGRMQLSGPLSNPIGTLGVQLADIRFRDAKELRPINGRIDADWRGGTVDARATIGGFARQPLQAAVSVPLRLSDQFVPVVPPNGPISGSINWQGEIEPLFLLLPLDEHRLRGVATISLGLAGTVAAPQASGSVALNNGEYENFLAGTVMDHMDLTVEAQGDRIVVSRFSARDGAGGTMQATGYASLKGAPAQINLVMSNFTAARRDDVTAAINTNIVYSADATGGGRVAGTIQTGSVEIRLINRLPPTVVVLDPVEKGGERIPAVEPAKVEVPTAKKPGIDLALDVSMPGRIFVRGRGLDSEWAGDFAIRGTADSPDISGALRSVRGQVSIINNTFELRPSTIRLVKSGKGTFDVVLDITAANNADGLTVLAKIGGTAAAPKLTLTSEPELPQDEVLARILFGKNTGQLTAVEAVQLAAALAELSGIGGGGGGMLDFTRQALGLDVLRVGAGTGGSAATVTAGKYIARNVFVGVEQGTTTESSAATVEIEVFPNVKVQSRVSQSGSNGVGVKAEWDY